MSANSRTELNNFVPVLCGDLEKHFKSCYEKINETREDNGVKQRISIISQISTVIPNPPSFTDIVELSRQDPDASTEAILPQHVQFISKLYEHMLMSPADLIKITKNAHKIFSHEKFILFSWSTIPSLFGYFLYVEHVYYAYKYYAYLATSCSKSLAFDVLAPFFRNSSTFLYISSIFNDLVQFFCKDARLSAGSTQVHSAEYAQQFVDSVIKNVNKLPLPHLNLLNMLKRTNWSTDEIFDFLCFSFVIPMIKILLNASPFTYSLKAFDSVVECVQEALEKANKDVIFKVRSLLEIPSGFAEFNQPHISFLATPYDAAMIVEASKNMIEFPRLIKMIMNQSYVESTLFIPLWFNVFPKRMYYPDEIKMRNIVFSPEILETEKNPQIPVFERRWRMLEANSEELETVPQKLLTSKPYKFFVNENIGGITFREYVDIVFSNKLKERAKKFENFIVLQFALKKIEDYGEYVIEFYKKVALKCSRDIIGKHMANKKPKYYKNFSLSVLSPLNKLYSRIQQYCVALKCQYTIDTFLAKHKRESQMISSLWKSMQETTIFCTPPTCLRRETGAKQIILNRAFLTASSMLNIIGRVPFSMQYFVIIDTVNQLKDISKNEGDLIDLVVYSIRICSTPTFINSVISICGGLQNRHEFLASCTEEDKILWYIFLNGLHKFISANQDLERAFYQLHDMINAEFA